MFTPPWPIDFGPDFCLTFSGNGDLESDHDFLAGNRQFLRQKGTAGSNLARSATQSSDFSPSPIASLKSPISGRNWQFSIWFGISGRRSKEVWRTMGLVFSERK